jgi:hypothetical protein
MLRIGFSISVSVSIGGIGGGGGVCIINRLFISVLLGGRVGLRRRVSRGRRSGSSSAASLLLDVNGSRSVVARMVPAVASSQLSGGSGFVGLQLSGITISKRLLLAGVNRGCILRAGWKLLRCVCNCSVGSRP